jgi:hypothetical protein
MTATGLSAPRTKGAWIPDRLPVPERRNTRREQSGREQLWTAGQREHLTPNRSAGRIEDRLWEASLAECRRRGLSNTDGMRAMIRLVTGTSEPVPLSGTGSSSDQVVRS